MTDEDTVEVITEQTCPLCRQNTLTLTEHEREVPYFGRVYLYSMTCLNAECKYHKADVECADRREPSKFTLEITSESDMNIRVIKSSEGTVKIPHVGTITSVGSNGYITTVEGVFNRIKHQTQTLYDDAEDDEQKNKAKRMLKKIQDIIWGHEKATLIIEDPTGNSAIISEKAVKTKL